MIKYLSDIDKQKSLWIERISYAFNMYGGYFISESNNGELHTSFNSIYPNKLFCCFRDHTYNDVTDFFEILIKNKFYPLYNFITKTFYANTKIKIFDLSDDAGFSSLDLKFNLPNTSILSLVSNRQDYIQHKKNAELNKLADIYSVHINSELNSSILSLNNTSPVTFNTKNKFYNYSFRTINSADCIKIMSSVLSIYNWHNIDLICLNNSYRKNLFHSLEFSSFFQNTKIIAVDSSGIQEEDNVTKEILKYHQFEIVEDGILIIGIKL